MGKFRMAVGILLILMSPLLFYIALDAESQGLNLGEPNGARGAALFDWLGKWGLLAVMIGFGIAEILNGYKLLKNPEQDKTP